MSCLMPKSISVAHLRSRAHGTCRHDGCTSRATVFTLCDPHFDEAYDGAERLRVEFEAMLAAGISNADANRILCDRIKGMSS